MSGWIKASDDPYFSLRPYNLVRVLDCIYVEYASTSWCIYIATHVTLSASSNHMTFPCVPTSPRIS